MSTERPIYHERIITDPAILVGKPVIRGTRISVEVILEQLALNPDTDELFAAYPDLTLDDVKAALAYAGDLAGGAAVTPAPRPRTRAPHAGG
jgi:uncharacterized protein (DUF433 family)